MSSVRNPLAASRKRPALRESSPVGQHDRRLAELEELVAGLTTLVEGLPGVAYSRPLDLTASWHYVAPGIDEMVGWSAWEWLAEPMLWARGIEPDDRARFAAATSRPLQPADRLSLEYGFRCRDGRIIRLRDEAAVAREGGVLHGLLAELSEDVPDERPQPGADVPRVDRDESECLGVIAYFMPVSTAEISRMCGRDCAGAVHSLLDRGLIARVEDDSSDIALYSTTDLFNKAFGRAGALPDFGPTRD